MLTRPNTWQHTPPSHIMLTDTLKTPNNIPHLVTLFWHAQDTWQHIPPSHIMLTRPRHLTTHPTKHYIDTLFNHSELYLVNLRCKPGNYGMIGTGLELPALNADTHLTATLERKSWFTIFFQWLSTWFWKKVADPLSHLMRKPTYCTCERQRCRSAYLSVQSDHHLCYSLPTYLLYLKFKTLASFSSWAGLFESNLVEKLRRQVFSWRGSSVFQQKNHSISFYLLFQHRI